MLPSVSLISLATAVQDAHPFAFRCLADASLAVLEFLDFMTVKRACNDADGTQFPHAPSRTIDLVWCVALTNTKNYLQLCGGGVTFMHRDPTVPAGAIEDARKRLDEAYQRFFRHDAPTAHGHGVPVDEDERDSDDADYVVMHRGKPLVVPDDEPISVGDDDMNLLVNGRPMIVPDDQVEYADDEEYEPSMSTEPTTSSSSSSEKRKHVNSPADVVREAFAETKKHAANRVELVVTALYADGSAWFDAPLTVTHADSLVPSRFYRLVESMEPLKRHAARVEIQLDGVVLDRNDDKTLINGDMLIATVVKAIE